MPMTPSDRADLLSRWIKPSSDTEAEQQERALRMVRKAIDAHAAFTKKAQINVYAKGSYANNTNVRRDSDVDIVVQCDDCLFYDYGPGVQRPASSLSPYAGLWTPAVWRAEVATALINYFGKSDVDVAGNVAIEIAETVGSRPSTDVVPSFDYRLYWNSERTKFSDGSAVYTRSGQQIVNWPPQQLENGKAKNVATGSRYKYYVRALKNAENFLFAQKVIAAQPSYLMECLIWNVANSTLMKGSLDDGFRATLAELWAGLDGAGKADWVEPNAIKILFHSEQKWTAAEAMSIVEETWKLLYQ